MPIPTLLQLMSPDCPRRLAARISEPLRSALARPGRRVRTEGYSDAMIDPEPRRGHMTAEEFVTELEQLITRARSGDLPDEAIIAGFEKAIDAIEEDMD